MALAVSLEILFFFFLNLFLSTFLLLHLLFNLNTNQTDSWLQANSKMFQFSLFISIYNIQTFQWINSPIMNISALISGVVYMISLLFFSFFCQARDRICTRFIACKHGQKPPLDNGFWTQSLHIWSSSSVSIFHLKIVFFSFVRNVKVVFHVPLGHFDHWPIPFYLLMLFISFECWCHFSSTHPLFLCFCVLPSLFPWCSLAIFHTSFSFFSVQFVCLFIFFSLSVATVVQTVRVYLMLQFISQFQKS